LEISTTLREAGDELLLFLHGIGCSRESFQHFWNRPEFASCSALAMDFVGFGESPASENFSYRIEDHARVCARLLENFSDKKLHAVAHSMGCAVALLFPDEILKSIRSFTSIEGNLIGADCGVVSRRVANSDPEKFAVEVFPEIQRQLAGVEKGYFALETTNPKALFKSAQSLVAWSDSEILLEKFHALACQKNLFLRRRKCITPHGKPYQEYSESGNQT